MTENIAYTLRDTARVQGPKTAIIEAGSGRSCSFAELDRLADRYGAYFQNQGVKPGDRVILMVRPSIDFIALSYALFKIGAPVILIDPGMGYKNLLRCIESVRPDYLIGIPAAVALSLLYYNKFRTLKKRFCCGSVLGLPHLDIRRKAARQSGTCREFAADDQSLAAIIFTTGSTGPPKGVRFEHTIFSSQLRKIKSHYRIGAADIDQPGFPLFALFSTAIGACAVIPDMDPSKPAQVDPEKFVASINKHQVSYSFGSPAIWHVVSNYCLKNEIRCSSLKKVLMAGAPVSGELIEKVFAIIAEDGEVHTPYGATESLPIVSIEGKEIVHETWHQTRNGKGACVGKALPGISLKVIEASDAILTSLADCTVLAPFETGEIIVKGDVVTRAYDNNEAHNLAAKISDGDGFWHRLGDVGYVDEQERLWFCGRKAHRVFTADRIMYTVCCEAITNNHPDVYRSALVGVADHSGKQIPVMVVELHKDVEKGRDEVIPQLRKLCGEHPLTEAIEHILVHEAFPVDIRHNAKIFREKLVIWAQKRVKGSG